MMEVFFKSFVYVLVSLSTFMIGEIIYDKIVSIIRKKKGERLYQRQGSFNEMTQIRRHNCVGQSTSITVGGGVYNVGSKFIFVVKGKDYVCTITKVSQLWVSFNVSGIGGTGTDMDAKTFEFGFSCGTLREHAEIKPRKLINVHKFIN